MNNKQKCISIIAILLALIAISQASTVSQIFNNVTCSNCTLDNPTFINSTFNGTNGTGTRAACFDSTGKLVASTNATSNYLTC